MVRRRLFTTPLMPAILALGLAGCAAMRPAAARPEARSGQTEGPLAPSWSETAYARQERDNAWHFAYAVQSWAGEQNGHIVMVPARYGMVVDKLYFGDEFSHVPVTLLRSGTGSTRATAVERAVPVRHMWTTHASSWDYDTDIKFVLFGPGFVKEGVKPGKTTLQNIAPTYARLIGTTPPKGSMGRVMTEALVPTPKRPRVILTVVVDGGGRLLYETWPDAWPVIKRLAARGVEYTEARVTQLETATAVSHVAVGTGGYPYTTRIVGNEIYDPAKNAVTYSFPDFSPALIKAPTLADEYGVTADHKPVVIGTSYQERAAMGMVGHGAMYHPGNKSHIVVLFDKPKKEAWKQAFPAPDTESRLMTNPDLFSFPEYLKGRTTEPYVKALTGGTGVWMGHRIDDTSNVRFSPAYVRFECDNMLMMMDREPIDQAEATSLIYMNMKPSDISQHRWGVESLETREVLREQDACLGRLVEKLDARVGAGSYVVTVTADHGMAPLPELVNGHRLYLPTLLEMIDKKFGAKISLGGGFINLWFDQAKMAELEITNQDIATYLKSLTAGEYYGPREKWPTYLDYRPDEQLFFGAYTVEQIAAYVKAHPTTWASNPYVGDVHVALERDLESLYAGSQGMGYLAYLSRHGGETTHDGKVKHIDGSPYLYRDAPEFEAEREMFEGLAR